MIDDSSINEQTDSDRNPLEMFPAEQSLAVHIKPPKDYVHSKRTETWLLFVPARGFRRSFAFDL
jgi:hypothetical protein